MTEISKREIEKLKEKIDEISLSLNISSKKDILKSLEQETQKENFWNKQQYAKQTLTQISDLKDEIEIISKLSTNVETLLSLINESANNQQHLLNEDFQKIKEEIEKFQSLMFLSGKYDRNNATLSIHSGQGGTEANDWTEMLFRMYTMYIEKKGWKYNITNIVKGNEVGIATVTIEIFGKYAYGILKREHGTHRLVRISPFNAQNLRQTSFAGVEVIPILEEIDMGINIPETDIEFKAVKSGGPGGQSVNKTSSAVQITHVPTGLTANCSEERSQLKNREKAMQILRGKLWKILEENRLKEISEIKGNYKIAGWGNQIRNYILHPYKLIKDLRTKEESSNPEDVLDGNLEKFLEAQLRMK
jgi:peptide chain release factor 2